MSKQCQFEDVTIIHCTNASHTLGHPCLVSLLFMASLYSTLFKFEELLVINVSGYDKEFGLSPSSDSTSITQKRKNINSYKNVY